MSLELTILMALNNVHPRLMPDAALLADVRLFRSGLQTSKGDFDLAMRRLEGSGDVLSLANQDVGMRWKISDAGRVRVLEANS